MIITCDTCSTKFNLDETRIKPTGSKVRCSVCRNLFTAFPPESTERDETETSEEKPAPPEEPVVHEEKYSGEKPQEDSFSGLEGIDGLGDEQEFSLDSEDDFSFDSEEDYSLDLDFEEPDFKEGEKEPEFDLELDQETPDSGIDVQKTDKETESADREEKQAEFDFISADDESFELEINTDTDEEDEEETFQLEEIELEQESAEIPESYEKSELESPEYEIEEGEFDLSSTYEMDMEPDDDEDDKASDELEFELDDEEEEEELGGDTDFEEEPQSEQMPKEEAAEEFDLTLFDESLEDDFDQEEPEPEQLPKEEASEEEIKERQRQTSDRPRTEEDKIEKPPVTDFTEQDTKEQPAGTSKFFKFILILLVIAIMLVAGYSTCIIMGIQVPYISSVKIPFIESILQKNQSRPEQANIVLDNQSINGKFASNNAEGKLFIITGRAANKSAFPISHLQVEATLITKDNVTARTKQVYCGNKVPEDTLKTAGINTIDKLLLNRNGMDGVNKNIRPNESIPFMIVFSNLPDNLENFSVKPAGHSRPEQEN